MTLNVSASHANRLLILHMTVQNSYEYLFQINSAQGEVKLAIWEVKTQLSKNKIIMNKMNLHQSTYSSTPVIFRLHAYNNITYTFTSFK